MADTYLDLYMDSYGYETPAVAKTRVKSIFALDIGGVNYATDLTSFALKSKPMDQERITFGRYSNGRSVEWNLDIKAVFDGGSEGSLHTLLWQYAGYTTTFIIRPFQEFDPGDKRYYGGNIRIPYRPDIKAKAGENSTFDYSFDVVGHPVRTDQPLGIVTGKVYTEI